MKWVLAAAAFAGGALVTLPPVMRPPALLLRPPHRRTNFRGLPVAGTLGTLLVVPLTFGGIAAAGIGVATERPWRDGIVAAGAGVAMAALGLLDDLKGRSRGGGFAGHLRALVRGEVTTGLVKAAGGGVVGLAAAWALGLRGVWIVVGGAVIALSANLFNLLDLRPGRAIKVWLIGWVALLVAAPSAGVLAVSAALAGGAVGFLPADLKERGMLGDGGANLLGAVLGVVAVSSLGRVGLMVSLATLVALTAASERVSFTRVIERVAPLRALDRLGRLD